MPKPLDLARLATVQIVPPTPFTADGTRLATDALTALTKRLVQAGVQVLLPAAGTGEFHSLTADEVVEGVRVTRAAAGPEAIVVGPVGLGLPHALACARGAVEAGADALLVMPPIHNYLSDAGFRDYFQALAAAAPLPLLAYKKGPVPSDKLLLELGTGGRLVGVKYAVNEVDTFAKFAAARGNLGVYCGTAERWAPYFMLAGAQGYTSGAGNLAPRLTLAMHRALAAGEYAEAMRLMNLLRPIEDYRARDGDSFNITLLKYALSLTGLDFGSPRPPMRKLTAAEETEIKKIVEPILAEEKKLS